ncbi:MAG: 5-(carboxyamino)imidazole ribonucleotide synthase [Planctomycetia bacterium]
MGATGTTAAGAKTGLGTLGIIGGGQLAKMCAQAASQLGIEVCILERAERFPARHLAAATLRGDWDDGEEVAALARQCDVVTLENEFVDARALRHAEQHGAIVRPGSATMATVQDKFLQKTAFAQAGLPLPRFAAVESPADAVLFARAHGWPVVLKKRRNGYDGKGNATVRGEHELDAAWARLGGSGLYVEAFCPFERELAIVAVRAHDGERVAYPLVETINADHICRVVVAPADASLDIARRATQIALAAIDSVGGVGAFGMELFLKKDGEVLVNEIAPRVHNTGHYTIEGCECSQFENHVRAAMGLPLGSTALRARCAVMVNLLGSGPGPARPAGLEAALAERGVAVHIYGKDASSKGRKMGHVTAIGDDPREVLARAERAAAAIRFGG